MSMPNVIPAAPIDTYPVVIAGPTGPPGPDVTAAVAALQAKVADLQARVAALEGK
jgi:hypothetical protein